MIFELNKILSSKAVPINVATDNDLPVIDKTFIILNVVINVIFIVTVSQISGLIGIILIQVDSH